MPYLYTLPNSTAGIDNITYQIINQPAGSGPMPFIPLTLVFVFFVIFLGGISRQKARTGTSDYAMWATVASMSTFLVALMMSLGTGFISLEYLIYTLVFTLVCGVWLFLDRRQSEI